MKLIAIALGLPEDATEAQTFLEELLNRVSEATGATKEEIISHNRETDLVDIRSIYCYIARSAGIPSHKVGASIQRTHATVLRAAKRTEDLVRIKDRRILGILECLKKSDVINTITPNNQ